LTFCEFSQLLGCFKTPVGSTQGQILSVKNIMLTLSLDEFETKTTTYKITSAENSSLASMSLAEKNLISTCYYALLRMTQLIKVIK